LFSMSKKVLIITGMHRSGTSVISQWLHKCGLVIGDNLLGPAAGNEEGHFEDSDFVSLHEELLKQTFLPNTGLTSDSLPVLSQEQIDKIRSLIIKKRSLHKEWGWKDPRTCLFLPVYKQLIPDALYLVIIRDPVASVSSLINRRYLWLKNKNSKNWFRRWKWKNKKSLIKETLYKKYSEYYLKVWISYNNTILKHINSINTNSFLVVSYDSLHSSDEAIFSQLKNKWDFNLSYVDFKTIFKERLLSLPEDIYPYLIETRLLENAKNIFNSLKEKEKTVIEPQSMFLPLVSTK
jgi:hypothetical protein